MTRRYAILGSLCALQAALLVCGAAWAVGFYGADERACEAQLAEARTLADRTERQASYARWFMDRHIHPGDTVGPDVLRAVGGM